MAFNELVLPQKIQLEEKTASDFYGKFIAEPYESGYGHTVGNSLRRILLSGMEGAAVTAVRVVSAWKRWAIRMRFTMRDSRPTSCIRTTLTVSEPSINF